MDFCPNNKRHPVPSRLVYSLPTTKLAPALLDVADGKSEGLLSYSRPCPIKRRRLRWPFVAVCDFGHEAHERFPAS